MPLAESLQIGVRMIDGVEEVRTISAPITTATSEVPGSSYQRHQPSPERHGKAHHRA